MGYYGPAYPTELPDQSPLMQSGQQYSDYYAAMQQGQGAEEQNNQYYGATYPSAMQSGQQYGDYYTSMQQGQFLGEQYPEMTQGQLFEPSESAFGFSGIYPGQQSQGSLLPGQESQAVSLPSEFTASTSPQAPWHTAASFPRNKRLKEKDIK